MLKCKLNPDQWFLELPRGSRHAEVIMATVIKQTKEAIKTCALCPARFECEEEGMKWENLHWGIWGGTTPAYRLLKSSERPNEMEIKMMELLDEQRD